MTYAAAKCAVFWDQHGNCVAAVHGAKVPAVRAADACDDLSPLCNAGGFVQQRGRAQIRPDQTSRACKLQLAALSWLSWLLWWDETSGASGDTNASADCGVKLYSTPFGSQGCVASMHCALKIPYGSLHPRSLVCLLAALFHLTIRGQAAGAQCHGRPTGGKRLPCGPIYSFIVANREHSFISPPVSPG
jgi:hypothetical protein